MVSYLYFNDSALLKMFWSQYTSFSQSFTQINLVSDITVIVRVVNVRSLTHTGHRAVLFHLSRMFCPIPL